MIKVTLYILIILLSPGIVMGTISSYRAGQKPHEDLLRALRKFTHRKNKR